MATVTFLEPGTDATQDLSLWGGSFFGGTGSIASASDQAHTGARSIKAVSATADDTGAVTSIAGLLQDAGGLLSFWVRFSSVAPSVKTMFAETGSDVATLFGLALTTAGKIELGPNGVTHIVGTTALTANTWYRVSIAHVITTTSNWSVVVYLNGVSEITASNANGTLGGTGLDQFALGIDKSGDTVFPNSAVLTEWFDDVYVDLRTDKSDCGAVLVTAKRPFSNGTTNGFTTEIGAGGSGYGSGHSPQVNERPLSQTNGWSFSVAGSAITEEYNVEGLTVGDVNLTGATLIDWGGWLFAKAGTAETASIVVGGSTSNISLTTTATAFFKAKGSSTYPAGSGTDVGIVSATTTTLVSLYEAGVLVAYTAPTTTDAQEWIVRQAAQQGPRVRNVMY